MEGDQLTANAQQEELLNALRIDYQSQLDESMGQLHNQFVTYISSSRIPLPQVLIVLEMLVKETIDQAFQKYLGE